jgi:hypothetical protein
MERLTSNSNGSWGINSVPDAAAAAAAAAASVQQHWCKVGPVLYLQMVTDHSSTQGGRLSLGSEVEAREPTPVACMFRPNRTRGQWGEPYGVVHKGGVQLLSYLIVV